MLADYRFAGHLDQVHRGTGGGRCCDLHPSLDEVGLAALLDREAVVPALTRLQNPWRMESFCPEVACLADLDAGVHLLVEAMQSFLDACQFAVASCLQSQGGAGIAVDAETVIVGLPEGPCDFVNSILQSAASVRCQLEPVDVHAVYRFAAGWPAL